MNLSMHLMVRLNKKMGFFRSLVAQDAVKNNISLRTVSSIRIVYFHVSFRLILSYSVSCLEFRL